MYKLKGGILYKNKVIIGGVTNCEIKRGMRETTFDHSPLDGRYPSPTHLSYEHDSIQDEMTLTLRVNGIHYELIDNLTGGGLNDSSRTT